MTTVANVTYTLSDQYATGISGATVSYGPNRLKFDILAALVTGGGNASGVGGQFTVNDSDLITALDKHPATKRTGTSGPPPTPLQPTFGPMTGGYGVLASRPPVNSVPDGTVYTATDDNGGTDYQARNGIWVPKPPATKELDYQENATDLTGQTNTAYADIPSMVINFTPRGNPFWIAFYTGRLAAGGAGQNIFIALTLNDGTVLVEDFWTAPANLYSDVFEVKNRFTAVDFPAGVPVTIKARSHTGASSSYAIYGATSAGTHKGPFSLRAWEA